jgi:hypothetical protein
MSMEMLWSHPLYRTITDIYGIRRQEWPTTRRTVTLLAHALGKGRKNCPSPHILDPSVVNSLVHKYFTLALVRDPIQEEGEWLHHTTPHGEDQLTWLDMTWHTEHWPSEWIRVWCRVSSMKEKAMRTKPKYFKCNVGLCVGPCYRMHHGNWIFEDWPALCWWKPNVKCNYYIITILAESLECYWWEIWQKPPILVSPYVWNIIIGLIIRYISQSTIRQKYP